MSLVYFLPSKMQLQQHLTALAHEQHTTRRNTQDWELTVYTAIFLIDWSDLVRCVCVLFIILKNNYLIVKLINQIIQHRSKRAIEKSEQSINSQRISIIHIYVRWTDWCKQALMGCLDAQAKSAVRFPQTVKFVKPKVCGGDHKHTNSHITAQSNGNVIGRKSVFCPISTKKF